MGVFRIQVAGGLVSQDNGRLVDQSSGQGHALLLAARKLGRPMVKTLGESQQITDAREMPSIALTIARYFLCDDDIGSCIEGRQQVELLEYEPDFPPAHASALGIGEQTEIIAIEHDTSGVGPRQPAKQVEQCRLTAARRADHADELSFFYDEGNTVQRADLNLSHTVGLMQIFRFDEFGPGRCSHEQARSYTKASLGQLRRLGKTCRSRSRFRRAARRSRIMQSERLPALVRLRRCAAVVEASVVAD